MGPSGRIGYILHILDCFGQVNVGFIQVLYLGRAPRTKETLPDFREKCRVTRHSRVFHGLTGSQRTPGFGASQFSFFLLFFSLLLLSYPFLLSLSPQTKMRYLFLVFSLFDLIPFLFHFPRRKFSPSFLQATCLFHNFLPYFILISFFGPHFHFYSQLNPTLTYELVIL